jgi:complex iron-sulfur molybdoenzyme family reductase subunit gamma
MKKLLSTMVAAGVAATSMMAAEAAITAKKVDADLSRVTFASSVWSDAKFSDVVLYPQTTIKMNDKVANAANADNKGKKAQVAALYNGKDIAFMVKWEDGTLNVQHGYKTDVYPDGFAIQFAADYSNPAELPYIGMGSAGRPAVIHLQKAVRGFYEPNGKGNVYYQMNRQQTEVFGQELAAFDAKVKKIGSNDYEKTYVSEGFRSMTEIKDGSNKSYARLGRAGDAWKGTLSRPMKDGYVDLNAGAIPVAFAVWDGEKMGRDGLKHLSTWVSVKLEGNAGGEELIAALDNTPAGDAAAGKEAAMMNGCNGCHQLEATDPANLMAPGLANIGGYSTKGYLRESLVNPSAVVVPGYNRNAHSNYMWYMEENGKRVSTMTEYSWLDETTMNNIVAYLQSLKAEVE